MKNYYIFDIPLELYALMALFGLLLVICVGSAWRRSRGTRRDTR